MNALKFIGLIITMPLWATCVFVAVFGIGLYSAFVEACETVAESISDAMQNCF